jgi:hypothetical protein
VTDRLERSALVAPAESATGLADFGDPAFIEPLGVLVDALEREAGLHGAAGPPPRGPSSAS